MGEPGSRDEPAGRAGGPRGWDFKVASAYVGALKDKNVLRRTQILKALGDLGDPTAAGAALRWTKDKHANLRQAALETYMKLRGQGEPANAEDEDAQVAEAWRVAGQEASPEDVVKHLASAKNWLVRWAAAARCAERPDGWRRAILVEAAEDNKPDIRVQAYVGLANKPGPDLAALAQAGLKDDEDLVRLASLRIADRLLSTASQ